ncbi:MAG: NAD(P)H-binding protein [Bacteroidetes bacterium]|nr:NAD(P)H-binding protein [Bacteroidota bacterium]
MDRILVTGGTGLLGSEVVRHLLTQHQKVAILSSQTNPKIPSGVDLFPGDLRSGCGLATAANSAQTIIHCASNPRDSGETDIKGTSNLLDAITNPDTHFIYISIAGIDKASYPYYVAKREVEKKIQASGLPYTILRTTQFHPFVLNLIRGILDSNEEVALVPDGMRFQSVDLAEVADQLCRISQSKPAGLLPEFGGPGILPFEDMVRTYLGQTGLHRQWKPYPVTGPRWDLFRSGVNLVPDNRFGKTGWTQFLARVQR